MVGPVDEVRLPPGMNLPAELRIIFETTHVEKSHSVLNWINYLLFIFYCSGVGFNKTTKLIDKASRIANFLVRDRGYESERVSKSFLKAQNDNSKMFSDTKTMRNY